MCEAAKLITQIGKDICKKAEQEWEREQASLPSWREMVKQKSVTGFRTVTKVKFARGEQ